MKNYSKKQTVDILVKSMCKMMEKAIKGDKDKSDDVVNDVLDSNYEAEVDPDEIPTTKPNVLWKKDGKIKGVNKLKLFKNGKKNKQ